MLVSPALLTGCGGSKPARPAANTVVKGPGFHFEAPSGWTATRKGAAREARPGGAAATTSLVSATTFALLKPYTPELFPKAAKELDGIAAKLAAQSNGTLSESSTVEMDGQKVRAYRLTAHPSSGPAFDERIGFVLRGKREFQLLCRAPVGAADPDGACALLYATFTVTP